MKHVHEYDQLRRESATAESNINSINTTIPANDPMREPEIRSQNELNCRQIDSQLAFAFPLCARYTIDVAADTPAVNSPIITFNSHVHAMR